MYVKGGSTLLNGHLNSHLNSIAPTDAIIMPNTQSTMRIDCVFGIRAAPVEIQWNPSGKPRNVSIKLQNLVHFHAPFFTNHVYFTSHDKPPLLKG